MSALAAARLKAANTGSITVSLDSYGTTRRLRERTMLYGVPGLGSSTGGTMVAPALTSYGKAAKGGNPLLPAGTAAVSTAPRSLKHNYKTIFGGQCCGNCAKGKPCDSSAPHAMPGVGLPSPPVGLTRPRSNTGPSSTGGDACSQIDQCCKGDPSGGKSGKGKCPNPYLQNCLGGVLCPAQRPGIRGADWRETPAARRVASRHRASNRHAGLLRAE